MNDDPGHGSRSDLASRLMDVLREACPGSSVELRGSLATGREDEFSDIDLLWTVPGDSFGAALGAAPAAIASVSPLLSFRSDPEGQLSPTHRLLFARLAGVPIWWRLDLEIRIDNAESTDNALAPAAPVQEWDPYESALQNALATVKALARGHEDEATSLLDRGEARIGRPSTGAGTRERIIHLATAVMTARPHLHRFAQDVIDEAAARL